MAVLDYAFAAIPMLGILIFVHELGHFVVGKLCGVRVLKFSLGFGSPIGFGSHRLRWERGGTEYVVAWMPLGGFCRFLGEADTAEGAPDSLVPLDAKPEEFLESKPVWQKMAISLAGPAMNLLLPVLIFMVMLWAGIPKTASVIGMIERASPAAEAGLLVGDEIVAIDGQPVAWWGEVDRLIQELPEGSTEIELLRDGEPMEVQVTVGSRPTLDMFRESRSIGWIGVGSHRLPTLVGVPNVNSPAASSGLRSGDRVLEVEGQPVEDWESLAQAYRAAQGRSQVELTVVQGIEEDGEERTLSVPGFADLAQLGVVSATVLVGDVVEGMPAEQAGLQPGDLILEVDDRPVGSFRNFADAVRSSGGRPMKLAYARDGQVSRIVIEPVVREVAGLLDIDGMEEKIYQVGIAHAMATLEGRVELDRERNPLVAFPRAVAMTAENVVLFVRGLGKLVTGKVGSDQLRGPITIIQIARKSLDIGWQAYLSMMILISINLGLLNLLPIPILDGGQLLIYSIEGIKRSPLSMRTREMVQQFGFVVIALLMGLAFWNDLSGQLTKLIEWLG